MIVAKELNGLIHVADIGPATGTTPGTLIRPWTPIGPGLSPVMTWEGTHCFIAFDYLGHTYARRLDTSVWPPQVVDPVTYTPHISLQEPADVSSLQVRSAFGRTMLMDAPMPGAGGMIRSGYMRLDEDTNTLYADIIPISANPLPSIRAGWRVYARPIGGGAWTILSDWAPTLPSVIHLVGENGSMRLEIAVTYGVLWRGDLRNSNLPVTHGYRESDLSTILVVDSTKESWSRARSAEDEVLPAPSGSMPSVWMDPTVGFFSTTDIVALELDQQSILVKAYMLTDPSPFHEEHMADEVECLLTNQTMGAALLYS